MRRMLAALVLALPSFADDPPLRKERLEDGSTVEQAFDASGVANGVYRRTAADGTKLVDGEFEDGERAGKWRFYFENGELAIRGSYRRGRRTGEWRFRRDDGEPLASGDYKGGRRSGEWEFFDAKGRLDPARSGEYDWLEVGDARGIRSAGPTVDGARAGTWTSWWGDGALRRRVAYVRGRPAGEARFWHPDGTPDDDFLAGRAPVGFREKELDYPLTDLDAEPLAWLLRPAKVEPPAVRDLASLEPSFDAVTATRPAAAEALRELLALDLTDAAAVARAHGWIAGELSPLVGDRRFGGSDDTGRLGVLANRRALLRWLELLRVFDDFTRAAAWDLGEPAGDGIDERDLVRLTWCHEGVFEPGEREGPAYARRGTAVYDRGVADAIEAGLEWLVRAQSTDGRWDCDGFRLTHDLEVLDAGYGKAPYDVGVTGLALLALLGAGATPEGSGPVSEALRDGVGWLLEGQLADGALLARTSYESAYGHAIATFALAEACCLSGSPRLRSATKRAYDHLLLGRNRHGGWRYALPPRNDNDTSVTTWSLLAVEAASRAGFSVAPAVPRGAVSWYEAVTDTALGRVGYDGFGARSSRTVDNEFYPRDETETMTAAAVCGRARAARLGVPMDEKLLDLLADRLKSTPPRWFGDGTTNDAFYWFFGARAVEAAPKGLSRWRRALRAILTEHQREDGPLAGSFDPTGPWGMYGGRVATTALCLLALEAPWAP